MKRVLLPLLFASSTLFAQTPAPQGQPGQAQTPQQQQPVQSNRPIWRVNLPGGTYELVVGAILGVSSHEYVVDGAARVTEVNVDTTGQFAVRFYALEPAVVAGPGGIGAATIGKVQSLMTEAAERSGTDAWKKVMKSYPTTTHQRTVEYRVGSKESLNKIFSSASRSLRTGRGDELTISD
jgi:hypothetical protein